ncbi:SpaA isopeptide-forming pilin-related protein [Streptomyces fractus]|uniref:SpaA isopeptide-forming pilin-related protein n=1 Tax=Streptomyces fractus TaxID=641806 RepID=UPI003CEB9155
MKQLVIEGSGSDLHYSAVDPSGTEVWSCDIPAGQPDGSDCSTTLTADQRGAYKIVSTSGASGSGNSSGASWNITVESGGAAVPGRVWTDQYNIYQNPGADKAENLRYWAVSDTGYQYQVDLRDYNGIYSAIEADSIGNVESGTCNPIYRSIDQNLRPAKCAPQRLFFDKPAADLPATAASADGRLTVAPAPLDASNLAVTDLKFTPTDTASGKGTFTYTLNPRFKGGYLLEVDTNGNGTYDDAVDRRIQLGAEGKARNSYQYDGLDGQGNPIDGCAPINARLYFDKIGEIHLNQQDVEGRAGGVTFQRLNGPNLPDATLYWDDTQLAQDRTSQTPILDGTQGIDSTAGVHGWDYGSNSWGNNRLMDDWTYADVQVPTGEASFDAKCPDLKVSKTADVDHPNPGDTVNYTVTVKNTGDADYKDATVTDDLSKLLDDATYNDDAKATSGDVTYTEPNLSWKGDVPAGGSATVTFSATVNDPDTGDHKLPNAAVGPDDSNCAKDSTDPDCSTDGNVPTPTHGITVVKKDAKTSEPLQGAVFELWQETNGNTSLQRTGNSHDTRIDVGCATSPKGRCSWNDLKAGSYYLLETDVPEGYQLPKNPVTTVKVDDKNKKVTVTEKNWPTTSKKK